MTCKNCGSDTAGNFCNFCGQKTDIHRVTFKHFLHEFFHAFTHADKGILLLIKELCFRPGLVAREYLDGKRKKYFNPLSFLIIVSALWGFLSYKTGYFKALSNTSSSAQYQSNMPEYRIEAAHIASSSNGKILGLFLIVPLLSILSWIFFYRSKHAYTNESPIRRNLAENLVLNAFTFGQSQVLLMLIFMPWFLLMPESARLNNSVFQIVFLIYLIIAYQQFFKNRILFTILKTIVIFALFIVLFWVLILAYSYTKYAIMH